MLLGSLVEKVGEIVVGNALFRLLSECPIKEFSIFVGVLGQDDNKGLLIYNISSGILVGLYLNYNLLLVAGSGVERIVSDGMDVSNVGGDGLSLE
jgi:hypothetical protein